MFTSCVSWNVVPPVLLYIYFQKKRILLYLLSIPVFLNFAIIHYGYFFMLFNILQQSISLYAFTVAYLASPVLCDLWRIMVGNCFDCYVLPYVILTIIA